MGTEIPIIFISAYGDIPMTVQAMKAGAIQFLTKPFRDQDVLKAINEAVQRDRAARDARAEVADFAKRRKSLTPREEEVLKYVVEGLPNKEIAAQMGTKEGTVKQQRAQMMNKLQAGSVANLVRMIERFK